MRTTLSVLLSFLIIMLNLIIGHFFAPNGIIFSPLALIAITFAMVLGAKSLKPISLSAWITAFFVLHDVGIKLYAGGKHNNLGQGIIHLFLGIGLVFAYITLLVGIYKQKESSLVRKVIAALLLPVVMSIYLYFIDDLGIGRHYWYEWKRLHQ